MDEPRRAPLHELPRLPREERTLLTRKYHRRTRALTNIAVGITVASCLVYDWDTYLGTDKHVFSSVRPAVRRTLDWWYGVEAPATTPVARAPAQRQRPAWTSPEHGV